MSRIGKSPVAIIAGVTVEVSKENLITVKGKLGELQQQVDPAIIVTIEDGQVSFERKNDSKDLRAKHGLYRSLVANMVHGVSEGYKTVQELIGVGYKAEVKGQLIDFSLGFSHHVFFVLPAEIKAEAIVERGKPAKLTMTSHDKQLLGQVAAKIRSLRKPEPYKGKGIKFEGEIIRRKAGKTAAK
ncbi:MAG: 50S ribosomal protein L6 [Bacteroidetes bacterium 4572_77]|nr:MAG: 50S ribosomal protein L6 [Bacteroidetes bacterium 4572_77]